MPEARETGRKQTVADAAEVDSTAEASIDDEAAPTGRPKEIGGPKGPEPTRFGDWERAGRCIDF